MKNNGAALKKFIIDFLAILFGAVILWGTIYALAVRSDRVMPEQPEPETIAVVQVKPEAVATESAVYTGPVPEFVDLGEFVVTHYCACEKCCGEWAANRPNGIVYTASGAVAEEGRTIAVDPDVIPYGTEVVVRYNDGNEAVYIAEDCGGAIQGNRIDVYTASHEAALTAGIKTAAVCIVKEN